MSSTVDTIRDLAAQDYKWGFVTEIDEDRVPKGLNEDIVRLISARKGEPAFMLEWRLNALRHWFQMEREQGEPKWANVKFGPIDYQNIVYYSAPKQKPSLDSLNQVDPELLKTYAKLGIPIDEQKRLSNVAVDAVFDSVSVATTFKDKLAEMGVDPNSELESVLATYPQLRGNRTLTSGHVYRAGVPASIAPALMWVFERLKFIVRLRKRALFRLRYWRASVEDALSR